MLAGCCPWARDRIPGIFKAKAWWNFDGNTFISTYMYMFAKYTNISSGYCKKAISQEWITFGAITNNLDQKWGKDDILAENGADWWWCFFFFIYCPSNLLIYILLPKAVNTFPFSTPSSYIDFITFIDISMKKTLEHAPQKPTGFCLLLAEQLKSFH